MRTLPSQGRLSAVIVAHAVKRIEASAPLEDATEMRLAASRQTGREQRLLERALLLAQRTQLADTWERWRKLSLEAALLIAPLAALLLALLAYGILTSLVSGDRTISAMRAFAVALGVNLLMLVLWALSVLLAYRSSGGLAIPISKLSLGRGVLTLFSRFGSARTEHGTALSTAIVDTLDRARLAPWAFGAISHAAWALAYVFVLAGLLLAFRWEEYRLVWATTNQPAEEFRAFVHATGWLPELLGFRLPDTSVLPVRASAGEDRSAWVSWLLGSVFVYGFLLRLLLAGLCVAVLRWRQARVGLDTRDPYFRKLLVRFDALEQSQVTDREVRPPGPPMQQQLAPAEQPHAYAATVVADHPHAIVGFELAPDANWLPQPLHGLARLSSNVAGSMQDRHKLLNALAHAPVEKLLFICDAAASPDRGTARFLRDASLYAALRAVLLVDAGSGGDDAGRNRWEQWIAASGLPSMAVLDSPAAARAWIEAQA